jgi:hypothetical protein
MANKAAAIAQAILAELKRQSWYLAVNRQAIEWELTVGLTAPHLGRVLELYDNQGPAEVSMDKLIRCTPSDPEIKIPVMALGTERMVPLLCDGLDEVLRKNPVTVTLNEGEHDLEAEIEAHIQASRDLEDFELLVVVTTYCGLAISLDQSEGLKTLFPRDALDRIKQAAAEPAERSIKFRQWL